MSLFSPFMNVCVCVCRFVSVCVCVCFCQCECYLMEELGLSLSLCTYTHRDSPWYSWCNGHTGCCYWSCCMSLEILFIALFECIAAFWVCVAIFLLNPGGWLGLFMYGVIFFHSCGATKHSLYFCSYCCGITMDMHHKEDLHVEWLLCLI